MSNDVCTIYYNLEGPGWRVIQRNFLRAEQRGPVYRNKRAALAAARDQGFTHYVAQWHGPIVRPHVLPAWDAAEAAGAAEREQQITNLIELLEAL